MNRMFIRKNITYISILLFLVLFSGVYAIKPAFAFNSDGTPKTFGLGFKHKTVVPLWLIVMFLSISSYMLVMYYVLYPKIKS